MSLLRSVLRKGSSSDNNGGAFNPMAAGGKSKKASRSSAQSFKSVASTIKSISSFYSVLTGNGPKVPKRRRPPILTFGTPAFYHSDPPPPAPIPGVEQIPASDPGTARAYTTAHAVTLFDNHATSQPGMEEDDEALKDAKPSVSVVTFSHAKPSDIRSVYHDEAQIQGEVRMVLPKARNIESLDIWLTGLLDCVLEFEGRPIVQQKARLIGGSGAIGGMFKKSLAAGTYIFPFSFPALPTEAFVSQSEEAQRKNKGEVRLVTPPSCTISAVGAFSGEVGYTLGVNLTYGNVLQPDDQFISKVDIVPRSRPIPREIAPFPLIPTREDWPFESEIVAGWMLLPFGGRGRFGDEMIEVEGLMGVPYPPVFAPNEKIPFKLILWSESTPQLKELASSIKVHLVENDVYGPDALVPRTGARKNRRLLTIGNGRIWRDHEDAADGKDGDEEETYSNPLASSMSNVTADLRQTSITEEDEGEVETAASSNASEPTAPVASAITTSPLSTSPPSSPPTSPISPIRTSGLGKGPLRSFKPSLSGSPTLMSPTSPSSPSKKPAAAARWASYTAESSDEEDEDAEDIQSPTRESQDGDVPPSEASTTTEGDTSTATLSDGEATAVGSGPSPPGSIEEEDMSDFFPGSEDAERTITLSGEVPLGPAARKPSFNFKYMSRHYLIRILIQHAKYNHITPSAAGIYCEAPVWITTDPPRSSDSSSVPAPSESTPASPASSPSALSTPSATAAAFEGDPTIYSSLPVQGLVVPIPANEAEVTRYPVAKGEHSDRARPTWKVQRLAAF